jgi:hypothetical protein
VYVFKESVYEREKEKEAETVTEVLSFCPFFLPSSSPERDSKHTATAAAQQTRRLED